jgi:type IV secretion system protein VirB5
MKGMTMRNSEAADGPAVRSQYESARREWLERYGDYIAQARIWRTIALLALLVALIAVAGVVVLANQSRLVPYVVKVDDLGSAIAVGRADLAAQPDTAIIKAQLARWVTATRSVYLDAAAQRAMVIEAYSMINRLGAAYGTLNEHMRAYDPFERAKTETIAVQVESVLPISGQSWRIEWREEIRGRDGSSQKASQYQATVTLAFNPPSDEETLRLNPTGLYITDFHWAKRL